MNSPGNFKSQFEILNLRVSQTSEFTEIARAFTKQTFVKFSNVNLLGGAEYPIVYENFQRF